MILTDGIHLVSDTSVEELLAFARRVGIAPWWFHKTHYDILTDIDARRIGRAYPNVSVVSTREIVRRRCEK